MLHFLHHLQLNKNVPIFCEFKVILHIPVLMIIIMAKVKSASLVLWLLASSTILIIASIKAASKDKHATTEKAISLLSMSFRTLLYKRKLTI